MYTAYLFTCGSSDDFADETNSETSVYLYVAIISPSIRYHSKCKNRIK